MRSRRKRSRTRKEGNHRQAPRPSSWDCPRGTCRFCGEDIIEDGKQNKRKHWHQACADTWRKINDPTESKKAVFLRERGNCQGCDFKSINIRDFDCDHIKPLIESDGDLTYWMMNNLQLLCKDCHKDKTKVDMIRLRETRQREK